MLAGQAAIAIDNAALFEEQQRPSGPPRLVPSFQLENAPNLNRAEAAVLRLLALGESNRAITAKLDMSENTVKLSNSPVSEMAAFVPIQVHRYRLT